MTIHKLAWMFLIVLGLTACGGGGNDTTADTGPGAPSGVTAAVVTNNATTTIQVSWKPVSNASKYAIYMASASGVTKLNWSNDAAWGMHHPDLTADFPHPDGLNPDTIYYFIVTALDDAG